MGLTRPIIESVKNRADKDPEFRAAILAEAEKKIRSQADIKTSTKTKKGPAPTPTPETLNRKNDGSGQLAVS